MKISDIRDNNIKTLYDNYSILKRINEKNDNVISKNAIFKTIYADEYVKSEEGLCTGILFVLKGSIKIEKINQNGDETNLYNLKQGEFCHAALYCISNFESLNIIGKAIQDSEICVIPIDVMRYYVIKDVEFLSYIYEDLYNKFKKVIENKEEIVHESLETRLIKLLSNKKNNIVYATHSELAFEIDSVREVVSRKLKQIEKKGYIKLERGKIIIIKDLNDLIE
ncbi:Crp/Fnr family transcriptional regulator [Clostridium chromiireducens]|uniref:Helix-turn-helix domain-containing protein n=1 Tax=Clostridium chromiireducens TaxID=225345 RepID=A0A1V4IEB0_9CLOT|nr:Crp/Fnr family transcriptional regulator [Clostridium chromiireducens]MVX66305.1 helix-turn-helix domain-containing protein [Clostridium chromiireducens]OPJ57995.1 transcriptional activator FtrB [Clostridium chromiireducens]